MTRQIALSGVAVAALMLAAPVQAQILSLGGDDGGSSINVNLGSGGGGGLLGLGGSGSDRASGDVSVNGQTIVNFNGGGTGFLDDGVGNQDIELDLFGPGEGGKTQVALGTNDDDGDDDVLLTLFGSGSGARTANVNVLPGGTGGIGGIGGGTNTDADVTLDLFGPGGGGGDGPDPTDTGSTGGNGGTGGGGTGGGAMPPILGDGTQVAALGNAAIGDCFTPNGEQIAHLLARGAYDASVTARWNAASDVNIVAVNLCPAAEARVAAAINADPDADYMQRAVARNARIVAELGPSYGPEDVLAVDQSGNRLTVYVY